MKPSLSKYIALSFLGLFLFTFTFQNISAITRNFSIEFSSIFNGKYLKSIHSPNDSGSSSDENPFESEDKDESETESETEFDSSFPTFCLHHSLQFPFLNEKSFVKPHESDCTQDSQHPLYLVICTFKI